MNFKFRIEKGISFLLVFTASIVFISILTNIAMKQQTQTINWEAIIVVAFAIIALTGSPIILTANYFIEDINKIIRIEDNTIHVDKGMAKKTFKKQDIKYFYRVKVDDYSLSAKNSLRRNYEYFIIILKDKEFIYLTNLICKPNEFITAVGLTPEEINVWFPYIDRNIGKANLS